MPHESLTPGVNINEVVPNSGVTMNEDGKGNGNVCNSSGCAEMCVNGGTVYWCDV